MCVCVCIDVVFRSLESDESSTCAKHVLHRFSMISVVCGVRAVKVAHRATRIKSPQPNKRRNRKFNFVSRRHGVMHPDLSDVAPRGSVLVAGGGATQVRAPLTRTSSLPLPYCLLLLSINRNTPENSNSVASGFSDCGLTFITPGRFSFIINTSNLSAGKSRTLTT